MSHDRSILPLHVGAEPVPGYRLLNPRGRGGFAEVWEAVTGDGRPVALKFISTADYGRERSTVKEIRSIQAIRRLCHPGLLPIHDVMSVPGWIVVAMELADGSLMDLLSAYRQECRTAMPPEVLLPYLRQVADALDFLNDRRHLIDGKRVGIQHADVKPNNVLIVEDKAMLADFGLATMMSTPVAPNYCSGTVLYAAPEVFRGTISGKSDQYSLAVTYHVLRTGKSPFAGTIQDFAAGAKRPVLDLRELTRTERPVIERALAIAPADRWSNCDELVDGLERAVGAGPSSDALPLHTPISNGWYRRAAGSSH